ERLGEPLRQIYSEMQGDLLEAIVKRLAGDHDLLENEEFMAWHFRKLNQLDGLNREAIRIIAKRTGIAEQALIEATRRAGFEAIKDNVDFLRDAHDRGAPTTPPPPPEVDPTITDILDAYQRQARSHLNLTNSSLLDQVGQTYRNIVDRVVAALISGLKSP